MSEPTYESTFYLKDSGDSYTLRPMPESNLENTERAISDGKSVSIDFTDKGERIYFAPGQVTHIVSRQIAEIDD